MWFVLPACQSGGRSDSRSWLAARSEKWTILCHEFTGPERRRNCETQASNLKRTQGIRPEDVYIRHDEVKKVSLLYHGEYQRRRNRRTDRLSQSERLREDIALILDLGDYRGRFFAGARAVPAPLPDVGPPEWSLSQAEGVYSLQVAVFYPEGNFRQYKKAAITYARALREEGYEAYYYHGQTKSMITVGAFGEDAVVPIDKANKKYSEEVEELRRSDKRFLYNYENGQVRNRKLFRHKMKSPSFLIKIPREQPRQW